MGENTRFWRVIHEGGDLFALRNDGGISAFDVKVELRGRAVVNGRRDWSTSASEVLADESVNFKLRRAMGAEEDPPMLHIEWSVVIDGQVTTSRCDCEVPQ